jgi:hypothetical protein
VSGKVEVSGATPILRLNDTDASAPFEVKVDGGSFIINEVTNNRDLFTGTTGHLITIGNGSGGNIVLSTSANTLIPTGNVGIGATPEAWTAFTNLQVGAGFGVASNATDSHLCQNAYYNGEWRYIATDEAARYNMGGGGQHRFYVAASGSADAIVGGGGGWTEALTIDNAGLCSFAGGINVSAGNITAPTNPAFNVRLSTDQLNFAINGWVKVLFDTERFDQGSNFNTTTNTFTAPVTGKYQLNAMVRLDAMDAAADYYQIEVITSNASYRYTIDPGGFGSDPSYWSIPVSVLADMDASDTAYVNVYQGGGTAQTDVQGTESNFSGFLAC